MRLGYLLCLLALPLGASAGSGPGEFATPRSLSSFFPSEDGVAVYAGLVQSATLKEGQAKGPCSIEYLFNISEVIRGESVRTTRFCSSHNLYVGRKYLVYVTRGREGFEATEGTLVRSWFFEIYDVHNTDDDVQPVVKIPAAFLDVPNSLSHSRMSETMEFAGESGQHKSEYNLINWPEFAHALRAVLP